MALASWRQRAVLVSGMRREDRLAFLLHPETADLLLASAVRTDRLPRLNDVDVCLYCRRRQCIAVCPTGALTARTDGRIALDDDRCIGCGACVISCYEFGNLAWTQPTQSGFEESPNVLD